MPKEYTDEGPAPLAASRGIGAIRRNPLSKGIASGPEVDLTGERMSPDALKSMVSSIQKRLIEYRDAHHGEWNDDMGEIVEVALTEDNYFFYKSKPNMNPGGAKVLWYCAHTLGKDYGEDVGYPWSREA